MSEVKIQQTLMPRKVYIGDTAELRCTFNSPDAKLKALTQSGETTLTSAAFTQSLDFSNFEIKKLTLAPAGVDFYQLKVTFIPWKTGSLQLPDLQLEDSLIQFQPIQIESLLENEKTAGLKDSIPPVLLPGTTYKIYGLIAAFIIILIAALHLILKRKTIRFFVKNAILNYKCWKSRKITEKKLNELLKNHTLKDKDWAEQIQRTIRKYLSVKYQIDFSKKTTSEIMPAVHEIIGDLFEAKIEAIGRIVEIFIRTDYIRYCEGASFSADEKKTLTEDLKQSISIIEKTEKSDA